MKKNFTGLLNIIMKTKTGHEPCVHDKEFGALNLAYEYKIDSQISMIIRNSFLKHGNNKNRNIV